MKECISNYYYDLILFDIPPFGDESATCTEDLKTLKVPSKKIFKIGIIHLPHILGYIHLLKYVEPRISKYKILVTGDSRVWHGTDLDFYQLPTISIAMTGQDLFYDCLLLKKMLMMKESNFKYAIIGLSPWQFHYDQSLAVNGGDTMLIYYLSLRNLHNFHINEEIIKEIFNDNLFSINLVQPPDDFNPNNFWLGRQVQWSLVDNIKNRMKIRKLGDKWETKRYPETVEENKQIFDEFISLCKAHNVQPIVVSYPATDEYVEFYAKQIVDEFYCIIRESQLKNDFIFIDEYKCKFLNHSDYFDDTHLNVNGSRKFSKYLSDKIMQLEHR